MGDDISGQKRKPEIKYTAQVTSSLINGEAKLSISNKSLTIAALFDAVELLFAEINALVFADYAITIKADSGEYTLARMGSWAQPFYDVLFDAYNKAVLRSMFVKSTPILTAKGEYSYTENGLNSNGAAYIHIYENSVVALPPDLSARRVPLCFVTDLDSDAYNSTLKLETGETYSYSKLGYDSAIFIDAVKKQIIELREKSLAAVKEIEPSLTAIEALKIAKLMPQGAAASVEKLMEISLVFVAALESKLAKTRAAESYKVFKELCDPTQIYIGFRKKEITSDDTGGRGISWSEVGGNTDGAGIGTAPPEQYLLWLIAPSPDKRCAAVEFAEADTATFVYRTDSNLDSFAKQVNRALEAISFKREAIYLSDEELRMPENTDYYMGAKRTAALQFVRSKLTGRIIHSGMETWKRKLTELWNKG
jgi:hypothetical protein